MFHKQTSQPNESKEKKQNKRHISELFSEDTNEASRKKSKKSIREEKESDIIQIHWDRIYRYVENFEKLFGVRVHVSKGELGSLMQNGDEYKLVPFSHAGLEGALFEMEELEEDLVPITPKFHQPGTGVADILSNENVRILRVFYDEKNIDKKLLVQLQQLAKVEFVKINFTELMAEKVDQIQLKFPKPRVSRFTF